MNDYVHWIAAEFMKTLIMMDATLQEEKHRKFLKHKFYYLFSQIHQLSDHPMNLVSSIQTVHISSNRTISTLGYEVPSCLQLH